MQSHLATFVLVVVTKLLGSNGKNSSWSLVPSHIQTDEGPKPVRLLENRFNFGGL